MARRAMASCAKADHGRTGCDRAGDPDRRVFDDDRPCDIRADRRGCMKVEVGRRLAPPDMLATAEYSAFECLAQTKVIEVALDPLHRARRSDRPRKVSWEGADEVDCPGHRFQPFRKYPRILHGAGGVKALRQWTADPFFERVQEIAAGKTHEHGHRLFGGGRVAD